MTIVGIDGFTILADEEVFETKSYWAKVRIRKDPKTGEKYIDVLMGRKHSKKSHTHFGINPNMSLRFQESRGILRSIRRTVERGKDLLGDEELLFSDIDGKCQLHIAVLIDAATKTIKPVFRESELTETQLREVR